MGKRIADYLVYVLVRIFICIIQALPLDTCHRLGRGLATLACDWIGVRGKVVDENLRLAFPELSDAERRELAWRMWEHLFLLITEIAHAPRKIHDTNWREYITFANCDAMIRILYSSRPKVFVSAHFGNFELAGYTLGLFGFPTYSVARPLDNPHLDRFINEFRGAKGQHILPKTGSAGGVDDLLSSGGTLSLLADQHAGPKGCWVDFFGRPASTHKAIAVFSLSNDAPLLVCYARRLGAPLHYEMGPLEIADPRNHPAAAGVKELTQWYTSVFEQIIRGAPEQYWWVHRRWKDTRPMRKSSTQAA